MSRKKAKEFLAFLVHMARTAHISMLQAKGKEAERFQYASAFGRRLAYMTAARKLKQLMSGKV